MTIFDQAVRAHSHAVDDVYAKSWLYLPMAAAAPNDVRTADSSRAQTPLCAFLLDHYARAFSSDARKQGVKPERPGHASSRPILGFALHRLPYLPAHGDRVQCTNCDTPGVPEGSVFEVAEIRPDGYGRVELDLNLITRGGS